MTHSGPTTAATRTPSGITPLVLGILSLPIPILGPIAIWLGLKAKAAGTTAIAGTVLGVLGTIWLVVIIVSLAVNGVNVRMS